MLISNFFCNADPLTEINQKFLGLVRLFHDLRLVVIRINIYMRQVIAIVVTDQILDQAFLYLYILGTEKDIIPDIWICASNRSDKNIR